MSQLSQVMKAKVMKMALGALFMSLCSVVTTSAVETVSETSLPDDDGAIPESVNMEQFEALTTNPPFTRSVNISDSLILTGIVHYEDDVFATLLDTRTLESHLVSQTANFQGWLLVGVGGDPAKTQTWTAKIQIPGGEILSIRYQTPPSKLARSSSGKSGSSSGSGGKSPPLSSSQLAEAKKAAVNYKEGFNADGYPKAPPPEMVSKLSRLSTSQREDINKQMFGLRNQGLGLNERRKIYEGLVDRVSQGRR